MDLRFLGKVLQGALIGLGAVLPGISGGVLSVVFGVYRSIMELLSDPVHKWRIRYISGGSVCRDYSLI